MSKKYAMLSASYLDRWIYCPPSARLSDGYEDNGNDHAPEENDVHALCKLKLKQALGMEARAPTKDLSYYNQEMDDCASVYTAYVLEQVEPTNETCRDPVALIEYRVDFSS